VGKSDDFIREFLDDVTRYNFDNVETNEEKQLIALLMIRNNLKDIRGTLNTIGNWVMFFGIITILGFIVGGCNTLARVINHPVNYKRMVAPLGESWLFHNTWL